MAIKCCKNNRWFYVFILAMLCCEMLLAGSHGMLGHAAHSSSPGKPQPCDGILSNAPPLESFTSWQGSNDHFCNLCYCCRLLGQSLVSPTCCSADVPSALQPIPVRHVCLIQFSALKTGNRSPPRS